MTTKATDNQGITPDYLRNIGVNPQATPMTPLNKDEEYLEFIEECLLQPPALITHEELADYRKRAVYYIREARIEELQMLFDNTTNDTAIEDCMGNMQDRIAELKAEGGSDE